MIFPERNEPKEVNHSFCGSIAKFQLSCHGAVQLGTIDKSHLVIYEWRTVSAEKKLNYVLGFRCVGRAGVVGGSWQWKLSRERNSRKLRKEK